MKSLFLSLTIHALVLFGTMPNLFKDKPQAPKVHASEQVLHVSIRLNEQDVETIKEKIQKVRKAKRIKKMVKKKTTPKPKKVVTNKVKKAPVNKVDGEKVLNSYITELRSFIESKKYYPKRALRMKQAGAVEICLDIDENGNFHDIHIKNGSRYSTLNKAALELIKEISKFKPLPRDLGQKVTLNIPLRYAL